MTKQIQLTQGKFALVDDDDHENLNKFQWYAARTGTQNEPYAVRNYYNIDKKQRQISMHRYICNPENGMYVDHINGDTLDNRRINLRVCSQTKNSQNAKIKGHKYKGVFWAKDRGHYRVMIRVEKKLIRIGNFSSEIEAARAYNDAAIKYFGEFARLNVINE